VPVPAGAMRRTRPAVLRLALCCLLAAGAARGQLPLLDPFADGWRSGDRAVLAVDAATGWPDSLWAPPRWQPGWRDALERLAVLEAARPDSLLAWRVAAALSETLRFVRPDGPAPPLPDLPGFADLAPRAAWRRGPVAGPPPAPDRRDPGDADSRLRACVREWRRAWLAERRGEAIPWPRLWRAVLALPPGDRSTGWTLWAALRRARGLSLAPGDSLDDAAARRLAGLRPGAVPWRELDRWRMPADAAAGLGAALLRGPSLRRHLAKYPRPPRAPFWQRHWLLGKWRAAHHAGWLARRLARRSDLAPLGRAELLRRHVDLRLSRGDTAGAAADLALAVRLAAGSGGRTERLVRAMVERARVLAEHRGWRSLARRLARLVAAADPPPGPYGEAVAQVTRGEAPACGRTVAAGDPVLPPAAVTRRLAAWRRWGRLLERDGRLAGRAGRRLARVLDRCDPGAPDRCLDLLAAACPDSLRPVLREAALCRDLYRLAPALPRRPSPLRAAVRRADGPGRTAVRHLLLGVALLLDDPAGQLAAAVRLPGAGLPDADRLLLTHPVPAEPALRRALAAAPADPCLLLAAARNESAFDPAARSGAGALGWLQVMPFHHDGGAWDPRRGPRWQDPLGAVRLGARLLADACRRRGGDPYLAVAEYNAGGRAVDRWLRQLGGDPGPAVFAAWIGYPETRRYTREVLIDRQLYRWLLGARPARSEPTTPSRPRS